jgi:hypothetical protein
MLWPVFVLALASMCGASRLTVVPDVTYEVFRYLHQLQPKSILYYGCDPFMDTFRGQLPVGPGGVRLQVHVYCDRACTGGAQRALTAISPSSTSTVDVTTTCSLGEYDVLIHMDPQGCTSARCSSQHFMRVVPLARSVKHMVHFNTASRRAIILNMTAQPAVTHSAMEALDPSQPHVAKKTFKEFTRIYQNELWGEEGGGSGLGSTVNYTENIRKHLLEVVQ